MRAVVVLIAVAVLLPVAAFAACEDNLAATAEYGSVLEGSQRELQQEVAKLRAQVVALRRANAKLEADRKAAAEKLKDPKAETKPEDKPTPKPEAKPAP